MSLEEILDGITHPTDIDTTALSSKRGLVNNSNTCYMNSVLQIILHMSEFQRFFLFSGDTLKPILLANKHYHRIELGARMYELFISYWTSEDNKIINRDLRIFQKALTDHMAMTMQEFQPGQQGDQHECLTFMLDIMHQSFCVQKRFVHNTGDPYSYHDELENKAIEAIWRHGFHGPDCLIKEGYMFVSDIAATLMGQRYSRTECAHCGTVSPMIDTFRTFEVHIPKKDKSGSELTLTDCIDYETGITRLCEDNMYKCDECGEKTRAARRMMIWRHPQVLIINIVRNLTMIKDGRLRTTKDTREVKFPLILDLEPYLYKSSASNTRYQLVNVGCHHGMPGSGHCYSYIHKGAKWYNYNDSHVSDITENYIQGPEASLLVYRQIVEE